MKFNNKNMYKAAFAVFVGAMAISPKTTFAHGSESQYSIVKDDHDFKGYTSGDVFIRADQSGKGKKLGVIKKGEKVSGKLHKHFLEIEYKDTKAFISRKYITKDFVAPASSSSSLKADKINYQVPINPRNKDVVKKELVIEQRASEEIAKKQAANKETTKPEVKEEVAEKPAENKVEENTEKPVEEKTEEKKEEAKKEEAPKQEEKEEIKGRTITMQSTAYTADPAENGGYSVTALGTPIKPGVAAVDPNVIPLGTNLYVEGYGHARAEDTGGAIKGNKIDLVFSSKQESYNWGRRTVNVTILD